MYYNLYERVRSDANASAPRVIALCKRRGADAPLSDLWRTSRPEKVHTTVQRSYVCGRAGDGFRLGVIGTN